MVDTPNDGGQQQQQQAGGGTKPWYDGMAGVDSEMIGHWTNKGWHTKPAAEVALEASKAWKAAERLVGVPANEIVRLPKDPAAPEWDGVYQRLGRPAKAEEYDFSAVKFQDGSALDDAFVGLVRDAAFKNGLSKEKAADLAASIVKFTEGADAKDAAETAAALAQEKALLDKNWGFNKEANKLVAQNAVRALGLDPETVNALEKVVGYSKVMEMFRNIGSKIGEDKFISNEKQGNGAPGVMSRDQAVARKSELKADKAWVGKFLAGDTEAKREMAALDMLISQGQTVY